MADATADVDQVLEKGEAAGEKLAADISAQADETGKDLEDNAEAQSEKLLASFQNFVVQLMGAPNVPGCLKLLAETAAQYKISISLEKK